ncbi:MAG: hypothetical protein ACREF7_02390 [Candidatus Saccharimonadales bacterium]
MNVKGEVSLKKLELSKANAQIVAVTAVAAFITVFCLVGSNYLLGLRSYQAKIITADHSANNNLVADNAAKNKLLSAYKTFVDQNPNVLGSNNLTSGSYIYNNATAILDALPSTYDFPALTSSLQKLQTLGGFSFSSVGGSDESATVSSAPTGDPSTVPMPFSFTVNQTSYQAIQNLFSDMLKSIRPLQIDTISISGTDTNITLTVNAHTYFQPGKEFNITSETIAR